MHIKKEGKKIFVVHDIGEELISSLAQLAKDENIQSAAISGIGALGDVVLGYYDLVEKNEYLQQEFPGSWEVISLIGNITWFNNEPVVHVHVCLGGKDYIPRAGHLFKGTVTVTTEIVLDVLETKIERQQHPQLNFKNIVLG